MKYVLLIMTVLQIKSMWTKFIKIFSTKKYDMRKIDSIVQDLEDTHEDDYTVEATLLIATFIGTLFLSMYYIMAGVFIGDFHFLIASVLFVVISWQNFAKIGTWIDNREDESIFDKTILTRLTSVMYLWYIGKVVYFLIITW